MEKPWNKNESVICSRYAWSNRLNLYDLYGVSVNIGLLSLISIFQKLLFNVNAALLLPMHIEDIGLCFTFRYLLRLRVFIHFLINHDSLFFVLMTQLYFFKMISKISFIRRKRNKFKMDKRILFFRSNCNKFSSCRIRGVPSLQEVWRFDGLCKMLSNNCVTIHFQFMQNR